MIHLEFLDQLEAPWTELRPLRLARAHSPSGRAKRHVAVSSDGQPTMRIDLHTTPGSECLAFEQALFWDPWIVLGWGHGVHLVSLTPASGTSHDLGAYFGSLIPKPEVLLAASAERVFCFGRDGKQRWRSEQLGIDGVVIGNVTPGLIQGSGEWDPPGGWRDFTLDPETGLCVPD